VDYDIAAFGAERAGFSWSARRESCEGEGEMDSVDGLANGRDRVKWNGCEEGRVVKGKKVRRYKK
jgi:hypothetical protein